jgi:hypothetical protein
LGISRPTVTKTVRTIIDERVVQVLVATLETTPPDATHWSTRGLATTWACRRRPSAGSGGLGLKPHLVDTFS